MSKFNPLVTIIIPVFNGGNYLKEAIDSALAQTYKNLEIIVVNDGSKDDGATERVALSYGKRIQYYSKPNGGTSTALNLGISHMKGDYFSWLSHDDTYYPTKIEDEVAALRQLENKNTIIMSDLDGINEKYEKIYETNYIRHIEAHPPREHSMLHPIIYNQTHGCTLLIPKACFDEVGLFDEKELVAQDFEFFYRAFKKFPHKLVPKILVTARDSSNRQGRRSHHKGDVEYSRLFIKMIEEFTEEEILDLAPSRLDFYLDMQEFFSGAGYSIALDYIKGKMHSSIQLSSYDLMGRRFNGHDLHLFLREKGLDSKQLVRYKQSDDDSTFTFNYDAPNATKLLLQQSVLLHADIVHLHLVHNIFDINYLPLLSKVKPTVLTLHDPFYLGGHCVHHFDCDKWQTMCHDCKYLDRDFRILYDQSALNFEIKKLAIQNSSVSAIVASDWMKKKAEKSPIWKGKKIYKVPFGIDQSVFCPGDMNAARRELGISETDIVLMFRADAGYFKGLDIIVNALKKMRHNTGVTLLTVGAIGLINELKTDFNVKEYGWVKDDNLMVKLYRSCNVFLMPSRQETFGLMAIEAMSCAKVVFTIQSPGSALPEIVNAPECGYAVTEEEFADRLDELLDSVFNMLDHGNKSADYARVHYSKQNYVNSIIKVYEDIISNWKADDETTVLTEQLLKYANDNFSLAPVADEEATVIPENPQITGSFLKRIMCKSARFVWKILKGLHLDQPFMRTKLYKKLLDQGVVRMLQGY